MNITFGGISISPNKKTAKVLIKLIVILVVLEFEFSDVGNPAIEIGSNSIIEIKKNIITKLKVFTLFFL